MTALDPRLFTEGPARDSRFVVKERWSELQNDEAIDHDTEFLHRQMAEEIESIEMSAQNLVDFPDAPWELRMEMARQCWDESRHAVAFRRLFEARGGSVGQYPILAFQYRMIMKLTSLLGRLAVANRSFEASGLDAIQEGIDDQGKKDDLPFVALFDQQLADELQHVRYANVWVKRLLEEGGARAAFDLARSVAQANEAFRLIAGETGLTNYKVAEGIRREAGFSDEEIDVAKQFAGA
jgi:uncharacterized ferritin-like protein (DUF455 family)